MAQIQCFRSNNGQTLESDVGRTLDLSTGVCSMVGLLHGLARMNGYCRGVLQSLAGMNGYCKSTAWVLQSRARMNGYCSRSTWQGGGESGSGATSADDQPKTNPNPPTSPKSDLPLHRLYCLNSEYIENWWSFNLKVKMCLNCHKCVYWEQSQW